MNKKDIKSLLFFLFMCCVGLLIIPFVSSCGKSNSTSPAGSNIQFQVVNLSPDVLPVNLWVGFTRQNSISYSYPAPSGYFSLTKIDTPIQLRSNFASVSSTNLVSLDVLLQRNVKYTLFLTGFRADSSLVPIFTVDTASNATVGRGKIRFINASPRSAGVDVTANGTIAFSNQLYKGVSKFIEIPPGTYEFKVLPTGSTNVIADLTSISILDGKVYTLYCYGVSGGVDSVAFNANIINNK
jgi:hypothetical protein